ncbi:MAG: hypothetical protein MJD61_08440 [Proteobacteria bacterium]|nr:hypothetical protein [Pseudomonadota bacterium]
MRPPPRLSSDRATPKLIYPRDLAQRIEKRVSFLWSQAPVGQPELFDFELDGKIERIAGRSSAYKVLSRGQHRWRVARIDASGARQAWSRMHRVELVVPPTQPDNERTVLFDELVSRIRRRDAFAPVKWTKLGTDFERELRRLDLRNQFALANTDIALLRALLKLSNARKDRHLVFDATSKYRRRRTHAPVRFYPDLADLKAPLFFVGTLTKRAAAAGVRKRDLLVAVNGVPVDEYLRMLEPYVAYSTYRHMLVRHASRYLAAKNKAFGPELYLPDEKVRYTLHSALSGRWYEVTFRYENPRNLSWREPPLLDWDREQEPRDAAHFEAMYRDLGFSQVFDNHRSCALYVDHARRLALLEWYAFRDMRRSITELIRAAREERVLRYDLIVDATHSQGGRRSALLVQVLAARPFKTTFSDLRVQDKEFVRSHLDRYSRQVQAWANAAMSRGRAYTTRAPYKLELLDVDDAGIMKPAKERFRGRKVALLFPLAGSSLDQFAAMIIDNPGLEIHTMGMPTGGFSKSWMWAQTIRLPRGRELAFKHSVGHTVRPNGELLEGNPALPRRIVRFTRGNFGTYFRDLVVAARQHLLEKRSAP